MNRTHAFILMAAILPQLVIATTTSVSKPGWIKDLTSPDGAVVSDRDLSGDLTPQKAFNDSSNLADSSQRVLVSGDSLTLVYTFNVATNVDGVGIQNFNNTEGGARSPKAWTFCGSNDFDGTRDGIASATWEQLDERSDETDWAKPEYRYYQFGNTKKFKSYKIAFSANNGADDLQFQKLEYFFRSHGFVITGKRID